MPFFTVIVWCQPKLIEPLLRKWENRHVRGGSVYVIKKYMSCIIKEHVHTGIMQISPFSSCNRLSCRQGLDYDVI